ncbi:MAG TPA: DUF1080 domain-containing protein [Pirellulales bacterium]
MGFERAPVVLLGLCLCGASLALAADDKHPQAYTDPADAGPDFKFQGEYTGQVEVGAGQFAVGAQLVARGGGKFYSQIYLGGLPGAGWDRQTKYDGTGQVEDGAVVFKHLLGGGRLADGVLTLLDPDGQQVGTLKRSERVSPTLGKRPPAGAIVLFDGKSANAFKGGRMTDDGLLMPGATSKQAFGDCTLHLEFRTPFMPTALGQARGNSGCYLQGRYEVQILDSFGLDPKDNDCGAIYTVKAPDPNMCYPPLSWQTYDIDYTAARYDSAGKKTQDAVITVRQNGEVVQSKTKIPQATRAAPMKEGPEPGPLYLQDHGNPVRFQNIWIVEKK